MDLESRHKAGIFALKVLGFREGNQAVVKHPIVKNACVLLPVPDMEFCEIGIYIDAKFIPQDGDKFKAVYQGVTLPEFVPKNGMDIA